MQRRGQDFESTQEMGIEIFKSVKWRTKIINRCPPFRSSYVGRFKILIPHEPSNKVNVKLFLLDWRNRMWMFYSTDENTRQSNSLIPAGVCLEVVTCT